MHWVEQLVSWRHQAETKRDPVQGGRKSSSELKHCDIPRGFLCFLYMFLFAESGPGRPATSLVHRSIHCDQRRCTAKLLEESRFSNRVNAQSTSPGFPASLPRAKSPPDHTSGAKTRLEFTNRPRNSTIQSGAATLTSKLRGRGVRSSRARGGPGAWSFAAQEAVSLGGRGSFFPPGFVSQGFTVPLPRRVGRPGEIWGQPGGEWFTNINLDDHKPATRPVSATRTKET
ncbi:hypothetical protein B0T17DRAFT_146869 [Bombardia bombarda]|uniref:Uncharacterized protein n=1 Tax=Bombardia bombarda TaxID=252184 RepID=A0AA40C7Q2_9PEZI|nr:hypothetical protein B0T17DRAFT_146869 [Bombardia bombarda]